MRGNVYMWRQAPSLMKLYQIRPLDLKVISETHAHRRSYYKLCVCMCACVRVTMGDARLRKYVEQLVRRLLFG